MPSRQRSIIVTRAAPCFIQNCSCRTGFPPRFHRLAEHYGFRFYDSCLISFALIENCEVLYSEDMQHGQVGYDRMTLVNPFRSPSRY